MKRFEKSIIDTDVPSGFVKYFEIKPLLHDKRGLQ